jgi:hypothetical protein
MRSTPTGKGKTPAHLSHEEAKRQAAPEAHLLLRCAPTLPEKLLCFVWHGDHQPVRPSGVWARNVRQSSRMELLKIEELFSKARKLCSASNLVFDPGLASSIRIRLDRSKSTTSRCVVFHVVCYNPQWCMAQSAMCLERIVTGFTRIRHVVLHDSQRCFTWSATSPGTTSHVVWHDASCRSARCSV